MSSQDEPPVEMKYIHRAPTGYPTFSNSNPLKNVKARARKKKEDDTNEELWTLTNWITDYYYYFPSILNSDLLQKGKAILHCVANCEYKPNSPCGTILIRKGVVTSNIFVLVNTEFIIPETVYNPFGKNPMLPESKEQTDYEYYTLLSGLQAPIKRYGHEVKNDYELILKEFNKRIYLKVNFQNLPSDLPNELNDLLRRLFMASDYSTRISSKIEGFNFKTLKNDYNELYPRPLNECEIYSEYLDGLQFDLKDYCGYAYQNKQFPLFENGTNHVFQGELSGGIVVGLYLEGIRNIKKEMFIEDHPDGILLGYMLVVYYTLASLYPPEDEEKFKKYAVCTSPVKYTSNGMQCKYKVDLSNKIYVIYEDPEKPDFCHPYAVTYLPFHYQAANNVTSYVRYLPDENGNMVDVQQIPVQVYTQVKLHVILDVIDDRDGILKPEFKDKGKMILGTPLLNGDCLNQYNCVPLEDEWAITSDGFIVDYVSYKEYLTYVYNGFCYGQYFSCTPSDFLVPKNKDDIKKDSNNKVKEFVLLQYNEATCVRLGN